ncbi:MAG TPA: hypothetical protein VGJ84_09130 [Polyangiaceae bacterium]
MRYLGIDVHLKAIVYCLVDATGEVTERGKVETTLPKLTELARVARSRW